MFFDKEDLETKLNLYQSATKTDFTDPNPENWVWENQEESVRLCTQEDFERVNALKIWFKRFPEGQNDGTLICDNQNSINGKSAKYEGKVDFA